MWIDKLPLVDDAREFFQETDMSSFHQGETPQHEGTGMQSPSESRMPVPTSPGEEDTQPQQATGLVISGPASGQRLHAFTLPDSTGQPVQLWQYLQKPGSAFERRAYEPIIRRRLACTFRTVASSSRTLRERMRRILTRYNPASPLMITSSPCRGRASPLAKRK